MHEYVNIKQLSDVEKTVIYIAYKLDAMVLSSDGLACKFANQKKLNAHGLIWLFDELVKNEIISHPLACAKINELLLANRRYREDIKICKEFGIRLKAWGPK